jgi:hypothetical protein
MVLVVEGLPYFAFPEKMKELISLMREQDDATLRIIGATLLGLGLLILFIARRGLSPV